MSQLMCPKHGPMPSGYQTGSPLAVGISAAALSLRISKDPAIAILVGIFGLLVGAELGKRCPQCLSQLVEVIGDVEQFG